MDDCLFCRIIGGHVPAKIAYEDDEIVAIHDVFPRAPFHVLVLPRRHVPRLADLDDERLGGRLLQAVRAVAERSGQPGGFRVVVNNGEAAGQSVNHLHVHVLAGRSFDWPPG
jgi:histidine triad (HIT) family protein